MSTTTNPNSPLFQLRSLMPERPLTQSEAYRLAEFQADHVLLAAQIDQPGTPDEIIAELPFVEVQLRGDLPISGLTDWHKPRWLIILNSTEPAVRRRFSLMHEFKHILDHPRAQHLYPANPWMTADERAERVADYFAASLLMPRRLVKRRFFEGLCDPSDLAAEFEVSLPAMRRRLEQLHLIDPRPRCAYPLRPTDLTGYFRRSRLLTEVAA